MELVLMQDADIFVKTDAGRDEIKSRAHGLSMPVRAILLMVDGQRNVAALRAVIAGSKAGSDTLDTLLAQGLIEPRSAAGPATVPPPAPAPVAPPVRTPTSESAWGTERPEVSTVALDLVLPTVHAPHDVDLPIDMPSMSPAIAEAAGVAPSGSRYEHLYAMMNEVVRDFLPAHRRYFFQLKIERANDAESLLELLHDLRLALAKSRGDAFAMEVVARLRNAA